MKELVHIVNGITYKCIWEANNIDNKFDTIWNITKHARPSSDLKAKTLNHFKRYNKMKDIKNKAWMNINIERGPA